MSAASASSLPLETLLVAGVALVCAATDLVRGRIYNWVTYPAIVLGLFLHMYLGGLAGLGEALTGFAVGFAPGLLLFAAGGMGGGDAKLLGALGALGGKTLVTETLVLAFLVGTFFALAKLAWRGELFRTLGRSLRLLGSWLLPRVTAPPPHTERLTIRFGIAICVATFAALWDLEVGFFTAWIHG